MAILRKISLHNFAQLRQLDVDLSTGLTVVVGPNGSGKTNALSGALLTLTSDYKLFAGTKASLIRRGGTKVSYAHTTWELEDGTVVDIRRYLKGGTSDISINGVPRGCRREADITRECEQLLGYSKETLVRNHYVEQSAVDAIIKEEPTDRVIAMASLFAAERLLIPSKAPLKQEIAYLEGRLSGGEYESSKQLIQEKHTFVVRYAGLLKETWRLSASLLTAEALAESQALVDKRAKRETLIARRQTLASTIARRADAISANATAMAEAIGKCTDLAARQTKLSQLSMQLQTRKDLTVSHNGLAAKIPEITSRISEANARLVMLPPEPPKQARVSDERRAELSNALYDVDRDLRLARDGKTACPHCNSAIDLGKLDIEELTRRRAQLVAQQQEIAAIDKLHETYRVDVVKDQQARKYVESNRTADLERLQEATESFTAVKARIAALPVFDKGDLDAALSLTVSHQETVRKALEESQKNRDELSKREGQLGQLQQTETRELQVVRTELQDIASRNDPVYDAAEKAIMDNQEAVMNLRVIAESRKACVAAWRLLKDRVTGALEREKGNVALEQWHRHVLEVAAIVKPTEMPKAVIGSLLSELMPPISLICQRMQLPFHIGYNEKLELLANHVDGSVEQVRCLSGGQRACVSIAFWLAKLLRLRTGLPILFIDEPAANLDTQAVANFGELLNDLSALIRNSGCQVIMTTHHRQLEQTGAGRASLYEGGL